MTASAVGNDKSRIVWWKRLVRSLGAATGLFAAGFGVGLPSAVAEDVGYRSATAAPVAWQEFARRLQSEFQQRLVADDEAGRQFQDYMAKRAARAGATPLTPVVRAWVLPDGKVERIEVDDIGDAAAAVSLRALLAHGDVGAPPPDMLQPLHLRLSLRPKDLPRRAE